MIVVMAHEDLAELRERLAARVGTGNPAVEAAVRTVPRHLFVPGVAPEEAYQDEAIVTKRDESGLPVSSSSQPAIMAIMLDQLDLAPGQRVLEIGAGTGYNAALISHIVGPDGEVTSIDIDPEVTLGASAHLTATGYQAVTVVTADGAAGFPAHAPYDRLIATVGVSDLAPAWLSQVGLDGLIVVPLDVRGAQLSVAFERRDGPDGRGERWASRSIAPCGFMRMRGELAGANVTEVLVPGLTLMLPDRDRTIDPAALAAALAAPPAAVEPTGVVVGARQVFWELNLWFAVQEPLACEVIEELSRDRQPLLNGLPKFGRSAQATYGIVAGDSIALLFPGTNHELVAAGYGPSGASLASGLAAQIQAWHEAGRPATQGLHVDAYPRDVTVPPIPGAMIVERPNTRFAVHHA
jgi:protein-L-isoaspartate(D-aspartate) O-methyltransferase